MNVADDWVVDWLGSLGRRGLVVLINLDGWMVGWCRKPVVCGRLWSPALD